MASSPQQGLYDPNGYAGGGTSSGYSLPKSNSLTSTPPSDSSSGYSLGGGRYDIQNGGLAATVPSGTSPTYGYAGASQTSAGAYPSNPYYSTSGADYNQTASYQTPPLTPQTSGGNTPSPYGAYGNSGADLSTGTYQADPNAAYGSSWNYAANSSSSGSYGGSTLANPTDRRDMGGIASLPSSPMTSPALGNTGSTATQYNYQDYQPGVTGYQPPNVPAYTPPIGYVQPSSSSSSAPSANPGYSPGTTSRYPSSTVQPATAAGSLPYSSSPSPYPSTTYGSSSALY